MGTQDLGAALTRAGLILAILLWLWMLISCVRRDPERGLWLWMLIVFPIVGGLLYFLARWLPLWSPQTAWLARLGSGRRLQLAQSAARTIGNAHQFLELGDVLWDTGRRPEAADAYRQAIEREPDDPRALWSNARAAMHQKDLATAKAHLAKLYAADPFYRTGEAALAYGRTLLDLGELDAAKAHVDADLRRRGDPEARLILAKVLLQQGQTGDARRRLEDLQEDFRGATSVRGRAAASEVRRLLRGLGAPAAGSALTPLWESLGKLEAALARRPFLVFGIIAATIVGGDFLWQLHLERQRSAPPDFQWTPTTKHGVDLEAVRLVVQFTGHPVAPLLDPEFEEEVPFPVLGIQSKAGVKDPHAMLAALRAALAPKGFVVQWTGDASDPSIAVLARADHYALLTIKRTNGTNYGHDTAKVIAKLKEWEARYPFDILGADFDWVEIQFREVPKDLDAFVRQAYAFCPDTVDQGTETLAALAAGIRRTRRLFLWWD
ncbi:MAG: DUF4253 domain-containing protein [Planctomycetes bacterium]|nr:DUF4253 domain-containing protein [Planctomycetota bacterium]